MLNCKMNLKKKNIFTSNSGQLTMKGANHVLVGLYFIMTCMFYVTYEILFLYMLIEKCNSHF